MKKIILAALLLSPVFSVAQNLPQCDSLVITCCDFGNDTLGINVSNSTSVLFDYPGFILFDASMDTIAKESVTYFGISQGPQPHYMNVMATLNLPFTGFLCLYSNFYDSLDCTFPFTIADTASSVHDISVGISTIFPNPSSGIFTVQLNQSLNNFSARAINVLGECVFEKNYAHTNEFQIDLPCRGIFILEISSSQKILSRARLEKN